MCGRRSAWNKLIKNASHMTKETFLKLIPFLKTSRQVFLHGWGEPLLHPHFLWMVRICKKYGSIVDFHTNGLLLTKDNCEELVAAALDGITISIDAATSDTYKAIRGGDFKQLLWNLEQLSQIKTREKKNYPRVKFKYTLMKQNLDELALLVDLAIQYRIHKIEINNLVAWPNQSHLQKQSLFDQCSHVMDIYSQALNKANQYGILMNYSGLKPNIIKNHCPFNNFTVLCDGSVGPCGAQKFILGNVNTTSLRDIWNNQEYRKLRKQFYTSQLPHRCDRCYVRTNTEKDYVNPDMSYVQETLELRRWDMCDKNKPS
ncbi:MAG: SPASM domain-containing protein [Candidatus Omnitrophica bacterium]|nr:SPASM domain-containing protein [Candidatus Omnitrophota bacterium]